MRAKAALQYDDEIARPPEFLTNSSGKILFVILTEDYRVRARPQQVLRRLMVGRHTPAVRAIETTPKSCPHHTLPWTIFPEYTFDAK